MPEREQTIRGYLETVAEQIRWKKARPVVARELEHHLEDQRDDFAAAGHPPEEAERLAVEEMGDPVAVGTALDGLHRPKCSWEMLGMMSVSLCLWLAWQAVSHWGVSGYADYYPEWAGTIALALAGAAVLYWLDYTLLGRRSLALAAYITAAALVPDIFQVTRNYDHHLGDYLLLLLPLATALAVYALREKGTRGLALCCGLSLLPLAPMVWKMRFSGLWMGLVCNTGVLLLAVGKGWFGRDRRNWWLAAGHALALLAALVLAFWKLCWLAGPDGLFSSLSYEFQRVQNILSHARLVGTADLSAKVREQMIGPLWGGRYDRLLQTILGNFGWLAFLAAQTPMAVLLAAGWRRCRRQTAVLGRLVATAVLLTLTWQAAAYLLQTLTGFRNLWTDLPYPLLSDGGAALVGDCALLGLLLSVFRISSVVREDAHGRVCVPCGKGVADAVLSICGRGGR